MRRRKGPTKKLAPTNAPEHACAHAYREDEGLVIEIDCRNCNGAHDLMNRKCLAGVMNALVAASPPGAIVLRRFTDKRYRGDAIGLVTSCSSELASINRTLNLGDGPSDKRCRTCQASKGKVLAATKQALLGDPVTFMCRREEVRENLREKMIALAGRCVDARECVDEALAVIGFGPGVGPSG